MVFRVVEHHLSRIARFKVFRRHRCHQSGGEVVMRAGAAAAPGKSFVQDRLYRAFREIGRCPFTGWPRWMVRFWRGARGCQ